MFNNKNKEFNDKLSSVLKYQLPDFVQVDHPIYVEFITKYFEYLESAQLFITGSNSYLTLETNSTSYVLDEENHKVILEDSETVFVKNELIRGLTSNATARVIFSDYDDSSKLQITSNQSFIIGERIVGETSDATAIVTSYLSNPIQTIQQFLSFTDVDNTLDSLVSKFRDLLLESFPNNLADGLSKQNLIKNVKDLYAVKGTAAAHQLFFKAVLNESSEIFYPKDRLIRASDGQWSSDTIIRVVENGKSNFTHLIGQKIYTLNIQGVIQSSAIVSNIIRIREKNYIISELTVDEESIVGTFNPEDTVFAIDPTIDLEISATVKSIVKKINVIKGGFYYTEGDLINIQKIGNEASDAFVADVGTGQIDEVLILDGGYGYSIGEDVVFDNLNTNGTGAQGLISVVGGSFLLEDATVTDTDSNDYSLLLDNDGDFILYENNDYIKLELPRNQNNLLLSETSENIIIEPGTFANIADPTQWSYLEHPHLDAMGYWSENIADEAGEITKIVLKNKGIGYKRLPTVSVGTEEFPTNGIGARLIPLSTKSPGIGHVRFIQINNFGLEYNVSPEITLQRNIVVKNVQGSFLQGDILASHSGKVIEYNSTQSILKLDTDQDFSPGDKIVSETGSIAYVHFSDPATAQSIVGTIAQTPGKYISDRSKISNVSMRLQDSYYYQDYSYVVKVARSINEWRNAIRRSIHPAGWNLFGEVVISNYVSGSITRTTNKFLVGLPTVEFSPIIFGSLFGRQLGTIYQGEVRENANRSVLNRKNLHRYNITFEDTGRIILEDDSGFINYEKNLRAVTLTSSISLRANANRSAQFRKYGHLTNLPIYAFATPRLNSADVASNWYGLNRTKSIIELNRYIVDGEYYTIGQFATTKIQDVSDYGYLLLSKDNDKIVLEDGTGYLQNEFIGIPKTAYSKNINVPPPAEIILSNAPREELMDAYSEDEQTQDFITAKFSEIGITWDRDDFTFDDHPLTEIVVNLTSTVLKSGFARMSLANLPIYAFTIPRIDTADAIPNWYGIYRTISNPDAVDGEYYTIAQFGRFRINETSVQSNVLQENGDLINLERGSQELDNSFETNINTFDSNITFDAGTEYLSDEEYKIPNNAYKKVVNVPPPGEIVITTT